MSYVKIWIHAVWGTKNRTPVLTKQVRQKLFEHIKENARAKDIYVDFIKGHYEHVHCLIALNAEMPVSKVMQLIKGESAFWANKTNLLETKLEWADEYFAVSVSESMIDKVRDYIKNQEEHHAKVSFTDEYEEFLSKYQLKSQG